MANNTRDIKNKIESVENTKQMTRAMEMVSAAKMKRATEVEEQARLYSKLGLELMEHLGYIDEPGYDLLELRPVEDVLVILVSSDRGLCGSYNSDIFNKTKKVVSNKELIARHRVPADRSAPDPNGMPNINIAAVGKKSANFAQKNDYDISAVFDSMPEEPTFEDILPISELALQGYKEKDYDRIVVSYAHFENTMSNTVKIRQVLPISPKDLAAVLDQEDTEKNEEFPIETYIFEPNIEEIVETVMPRMVEVEIYQAIINAVASEHSSRMIAMKNAKENAEEKVEELTLTYNQARQRAITREISEISAGAEALGE
jgi:F-type H+-transporting ATPase subunit gamma